MHSQSVAYVRALLLLAAISVGLAYFVWRRYRRPKVTWCVLLILAVAGWLVGYALELGSATLSAKILWAKIQYLGIGMVPFAWLAFVLRYTGQDRWLTPRNLALLAIVRLVTLALVWTTELHGLVFQNVRLDPSGSFLVVDFGLWFWVDTAYAYLLLTIGSVALLQQLLSASYPYRGQAAALLIGVSIPWVVQVLSLSNLNPVPYLDLTPFSFLFTVLAAVWGVAQFRLFDIVPVARDAVIRSMSDGLIVLDPWNRVVDINPAAQRIIGQRRGEALDLEPARVLFAEPDLIVRRRDGAEEVHSEIVLTEGEEHRHYDLCITPLHDGRDRLVGQLIHLSDITEHRRADEEREKLIARLEEALAQVRALRGLVPVCASCKRIRDYAGRWRGMEEYVASHSNAEFSHGLCPECSKRLYPDFSYEGGAHHSVGA